MTTGNDCLFTKCTQLECRPNRWNKKMEAKIGVATLNIFFCFYLISIIFISIESKQQLFHWCFPFAVSQMQQKLNERTL